jgi:hypothetical protein
MGTDGETETEMEMEMEMDAMGWDGMNADAEDGDRPPPHEAPKFDSAFNIIDQLYLLPLPPITGFVC